MKEKLLSLLLTLGLATTFVPMAAFAANAQNINVWDGSTAAAFAGGTGTAEDPYQIANGAELAYLASSQTAEKRHVFKRGYGVLAYSKEIKQEKIALTIRFIFWTAAVRKDCSYMLRIPSMRA